MLKAQREEERKSLGRRIHQLEEVISKV